MNNEQKYKTYTKSLLWQHFEVGPMTSYMLESNLPLSWFSALASHFNGVTFVPHTLLRLGMTIARQSSRNWGIEMATTKSLSFPQNVCFRIPLDYILEGLKNLDI